MNNFYAVPYYIAVGLVIGIIVAIFLPSRFTLLNRFSAAGAIGLIIGWAVYIVREVFGI